MKILFITNYITPYRLPFYNKLLGNIKYDWILLHSIKNKEDGRPSYSGELNFPNIIIKDNEFKLGPYTLRYQQNLISHIIKIKPKVIILLGISGTISNWIVLVLAKVMKIKTVLWTCGWEAQEDSKFALFIKQFFLKIFFRLSDRIILYSKKAVNYLTYLGINSSKLFVAYNGLDIDEQLKKEENIWAKAKEIRMLEKQENTKIFLFVGGLIKEKGVELLIRSFKTLQEKNCFLWIIGDGPDKEYLLNFAKEIGVVKIKFFGRIIMDVDQYFAASDFFVLPGIGGLALNQAMFWKIPCIVSQADGTEDDLVLNKVNGLRFRRDDQSSLEEALKYVVNLDKEKRELWGNICREKILGQSNVDLMVGKFISVIDEFYLPIQK